MKQKIKEFLQLDLQSLKSVKESSAPSRIVNVSSMAHKHAPKGEIEFDKINDPDAQAPNSTL
ncbi:396_t:CDS:2 [Entrophospora sp. SA101]|nr:396_t:CDS:2 [Entrophospora sp. SA101]